jgi:hypothetical protein
MNARGEGPPTLRQLRPGDWAVIAYLCLPLIFLVVEDLYYFLLRLL